MKDMLMAEQHALGCFFIIKNKYCHLINKKYCHFCCPTKFSLFFFVCRNELLFVYWPVLCFSTS